ncbi:MAG: CAP domain-containing protein, partial [Planctomycetota bacterium]|nr:CAP domain-containing protein [Planctomycetota bacterium]
TRRTCSACLMAAVILAALAMPAAGQLRIPPKGSPPPTPTTAPGDASAAPSSDKKTPADLKREAADLPVQFRKKKGDAEGRKAVVDRAIELGGAAVTGVLAAVQAEMAPLAPKYRQAFYKEAQQKVRTKLADTKPQDIEALRQTIKSTVALADLTKEVVVEKADPALKQLEEKMLVTPDAVLADAEPLKKMRDELTVLAQFAQRLTDALPPPAPKTGAPPAAKDGSAAAPPAPTPKFEEALATDEEVATLMVIAADDKARKVLLDNVPLELKIQPEEAKGIRFFNQVRLLAGLGPCAIDTRLCDAGRDHAKDMVEKSFFAHESPVAGKKTPWDRAKNFGASANAENIANGASSGAATIMQWWHSPGHLKNMMGSHNRVGLGNFKTTWTQMLG